MTQQSRIPLIIDSDPGVDDVLAILLALASPEVDLQAITLTFGNTTLDHAHSNIYRMGTVLRKHLNDPKTDQKVKDTFEQNFGLQSKEIKVAIGAKGPLGGKMFTAGYFHGRDGLSSISTLPNDPFPTTDPSVPSSHPLVSTELSSCDLILKVLSENPVHTVRIAAIGPLSNIALAFQKDPKTFSRLGSLSIMGCTLDGPGNTTPVAEFNTFADPTAAKIILEDAPNHPFFDESKGKRGLKSFVLPLDITERHVVPYSNMVKEGEELKKSGILGAFISALLTRPRKVTNSYVPKHLFNAKLHDNFQAHDPLAVAHAVFGLQNDEQNRALTEDAKHFNGWQVAEREFEIEYQGERTRGMCVVDRRNHGLESGSSKNRAEQNQKEEAEQDAEKSAANGTEQSEDVDNGASEIKAKPIKVVTESPGIEWFAQIFTERLGF